ncbi:MAG: ABC transporter ATP-binding protein [Anaerolineales bacterium]|nr:ABC transporter ATP-binding protein [Anaerolineales bacterium]
MFNQNDQLLGAEVRKARDIGPTLARLWRLFTPYRLVILGVFSLVIISTSMQVAIPALTGQAVNCYLEPLSESSAGEAAAAACWFTTPDPTWTASDLIAGLGGLVLLIVVFYLGNAALSGLQFYLMAWAGQHVLRNLQRDIFHQAHRLTMSYFTEHEAGDVMSRLTNDVDTLQQIIGFGLVSVMQGSLLLIMIMIAMFTMNVPFALVSLITLPLMFLATRWLSTQARRAFRQARQEIGSINADLQESISGVREVQAFGREEENIAEFRNNNAANRDANIRAQAFSTALAPTLEALSFINMAIVVGAVGYFILNQVSFLGTAVTLGLIITFVAYTQQFNQPVQQIAVLWTNIQSAIAGSERIFDFLDEDPAFQEAEGATNIPPLQGEVTFENVWAEYKPGEPVLQGVNLHTRPGQTIAIVGPTGAGKTTILNLIPRFYDVSQGAVKIDGHDVRTVTRQSLRSQIGIVLQDAFLFSDTVMSNIRYGRLDATDEEVIAAAKLAHAHEFILKLEEGYDTVLGERGSGLSQGQRQLISIARAALANPRILILDEATSNVDTRTEREIQKALDTLMAERTSFVVAHRLSTIRNADQVLVLKAGQVIETGTHEELLAQRGFYFELYMSQFRREEEAPV